MSYGIILNDASGNTMLDTSSISTTVKDVIDTAAGVNGSRSYSDIVGKVLSITTISSTLVFDYRDSNGSIAALKPNVTVTYPAGVPTVTWTYSKIQASDVFVDATIVVFAK